MKPGLSKLLLTGGALLGVVMLTALLIHAYNLPGPAERRQNEAMTASPQMLQQMQTQAIRLFEEWRYAEAEQVLRRLLSYDRNNIAALRALGNVYYMSERYYDAGNIFRAILTRRPQDPAARNNLGMSMIKMQLYEAGIRELLAARAIAPELPGLDLNLGRAYEELGELDQAEHYHTLAEAAAEKARKIKEARETGAEP